MVRQHSLRETALKFRGLTPRCLLTPLSVPHESEKRYISQELFEKLYKRGLELITRYQKKMKQKLVKLVDKILLRKRSLIETVNDQLKNISQIEHSRHRSIWNFFVNLFAGLIAYTYLPQKPSLDLKPKGLPALPPALF